MSDCMELQMTKLERLFITQENNPQVEVGAAIFFYKINFARQLVS